MNYSTLRIIAGFLVAGSLLATSFTVSAAPTEASVKKTAAAPKKTLYWAGCGITKKAFMAELAAAYEKKTGVKIKLQGGGATKGIRTVAARTKDIGGSCRNIIESPRTLIPDPKERRVQMMPVAWDALVVLAHPDNPANNITMDQVRALYTGKITNWKQLGGNDAPIELYVRRGKISGVGRTLRELVFNDYDQDFVGKYIVKSSGPLEKGIQKNINGIGISGVSSARRRKVKLLKLEGKEPSYENIKNGDYLLYRPLYLVTHLQNNDPDVRNFALFAHSEEAKEIMRKVGTVPYEDAIALWLKYLNQQNKAMARGLTQKVISSKR